MRIAVIDITTRRVVNVIEASLDDAPYPGTLFVELPDEVAAVRDRYSYDAGWVPDADYASELAASEAAFDAEAHDFGGAA